MFRNVNYRNVSCVTLFVNNISIKFRTEILENVFEIDILRKRFISPTIQSKHSSLIFTGRGEIYRD